MVGWDSRQQVNSMLAPAAPPVARPDLGLTRAGGCSLARAAGRCRAFKSCAYHRAALDPGGGVWAAPGPAGKIEGAGDRKLGSGVARMVARRIERSPEAARLDDARGRLTGGVGLGLAITERAVRFHGGSVSATNRAEGGLMVEIHLPLMPASPIAEEAHEPQAVATDQ